MKLFPPKAVRLTMPSCIRLLLPITLLCATTASLAQDAAPGTDVASPPKYPLRLHVLAIDDTHHTVRMQPNWCGGSAPDIGTGESSPCSASGSTSLGGGDDDFAGSGRASLVTPPDTTVGLNFTYEACSRVRVALGFAGLEARWRKPNEKLEVIIPTEAITDGPVKMQRCTFKVIPQDFIYLRVRSGAIIRVSQQVYASKPALRRYLSGGTQQLERRKPLTKVKVTAQP